MENNNKKSHTVKLSKRLMMVADFVEEGARLADIGSDHAKLPIYLLEEGRINFAIAGEVAKGPFEITQAHIKKFPEIEARFADGLTAIELTDQIDTIAIAGMGGILISRILEEGKNKLSPVKRLILQANTEEAEIRHWLVGNSFKIIAESIVEDAGKIYEVIVAEPGQQTLSPKEEKFGLFLYDNPVFQKKWQKKLVKLENVLGWLPEDKVAERKAVLAEKKEVEELLKK